MIAVAVTRSLVTSDLQMILQLDPENVEASELLPSGSAGDSKVRGVQTQRNRRI